MPARREDGPGTLRTCPQQPWVANRGKREAECPTPARTRQSACTRIGASAQTTVRASHCDRLLRLLRLQYGGAHRCRTTSGEDLRRPPSECACMSSSTIVSAHPPARTAPRGAGAAGVLRGREKDPRWARPSLLGLLVATAGLYLWGLSANG